MTYKTLAKELSPAYTRDDKKRIAYNQMTCNIGLNV
jgi:hypothetical protein